MHEINLLEHSTYNVALIAKNKELFNTLFNQIAKTYQLFNVKDWSESNNRHISLAPTRSRIHNVYFTIRSNGEFNIVFRGNLGRFKDTTIYDFTEYSMDCRLEIKGITFENYQQHIPTIVKALECCEYSFV